MDKLIVFLENASRRGLYLPLAYDAVKDQPSVTLFFMWIANALAILSLITLHILTDKTTATTITCLYAISSTILYMIRRIHKVKADLDAKSIELESEEEK